MAEGRLKAWHGTVRGGLTALDPRASRVVMHDEYWSPGGPASRCSFLTTDRAAASAYSFAARNGMVPMADALASVTSRLEGLPAARQLFEDLLLKGQDAAWDAYMALSPNGSFKDHPEHPLLEARGIDLNDFNDLSQIVEGSAVVREKAETADSRDYLFALLTGSSSGGVNRNNVDVALRFGIDWRPRIYELDLDPTCVIDADSRAQAEEYLNAGASAVRIPPDDMTIRGTTDEIVVADPSAMRILAEHVVRWDYKTAWEALQGRSSRFLVLTGDEAHGVAAGHPMPVLAQVLDLSQADDALMSAENGLLVGLTETGHPERMEWISRRGDGQWEALALPVPDLAPLREPSLQASVGLAPA